MGRQLIIAGVALTLLPTTESAAQSLQLVVQPTETQGTAMVQGVQLLVSKAAGTELRMVSFPPDDKGRAYLGFVFVNQTSQPINIGPEYVSATTLKIMPYSKLVEEQRRREGRKKFWNALASIGNNASAANAGTSYGTFNYSGMTSSGGMYSGSGTVQVENPYVTQLARAQAAAENEARTQEMYRSFEQARADLTANLQTSTIMPFQQIAGILTFDLPRELRKAKSGQPFTITIQMGADVHKLEGLAGPVGKLPAIAPKFLAPLQSADTGNIVATAPLVAPVNGLKAAALTTPAEPKPTSKSLQPIQVSIEEFRRGYYGGQPDKIAALAKQGYAPAQDELGMLYQTGKGVPQSNAEAIRLYRLAAAQGNRSAQANLAYMYENGLGLKKDIAAAKRYYRLAADQGDEGARIRLGALGG